MDFESLKEQLIESLKTTRNKIEDSELFIKLKERFDNLPSLYQKLIIYFSIFLGVYFIYSIPASFVASGEEKLSYFEENRQLTRELIRAGRLARTIQLPPPAPSPDSLTSLIEDQLIRERVMADQKLGTKPVSDLADSSLVPKTIQQSGLKTTLKQLNLKQVIKIGEGLSAINSSQLMNIAIQADSKDPHYFNVDYELATFSVPQDPIEVIDPKNNKKSPFKRKAQ